jgi:hypothetical protein
VPQAGVYDREKDNQFETKPDWLELTSMFERAEAEAPKIYDYEAEISEPVEQTSRESLRGRAKRIMGRASDFTKELLITGAATVQAKTEGLREYYGDNERGNKRQKVTAAVAGTVLLGGLVYLNAKGAGVSFKGVQKEAAASFIPPVKAPHHEHLQHVQRFAETTLHQGGEPWTISEKQLEAHGVAHPTDAQILSYDKRLLRLKHISLQKARHLFAGMKLLLPKVQ